MGNSASQSFVIPAVNYYSKAAESLNGILDGLCLQVIDDILLKKHLSTKVTPTLVHIFISAALYMTLLRAFLYVIVPENLCVIRVKQIL